MDNPVTDNLIEGIAIIGMAGRFPGARNVEQFWLNLRDGVESISFFTDQELLAAGVDPALLAHPNYVKAGGVLEDIEYFDAGFFGFNPREAEITDPQQRLFLECAWEAMENAGYDTERYEGAIGVYAGVGMNSYLLNLYTNRELMSSVGTVQVAVGNDKDHLPTRVSYKLNLKGPSITVQTACSTSLVAVHLACQSLLSYQCDMALAGGVKVDIRQKDGYIYQEGGILSPDGHCRTFDAAAAGTVSGSGVGIVVLKRLSDAIADGDHIEAVIKGSAINNDGALKVGYTAPSIQGQAEVIAMAQAISGVEPETLSYIEAHGTATSLGDPIEFAALTHCFRASSSSASAFCAIGSVKSNIGHLDTAAGVAGLIKTTLALKHKQIPPSLHFSAPNPQIDFSDSPFYVNTALQHWPSSSTPRRAGVSSFGIGGTNAHLLLEEAPQAQLADAATSSAPQLLLLSARSNSALEKAVSRLSQHLSHHPELSPADVAYTLQVGRRAFSHRRAVLCHTIEDAITALDGRSVGRVFDGHSEAGARRVVMMFSGQGGCYPNMGLGLYQSEPRFREVVDECAALLMPHLGLDLRQLLYPGAAQRREAEQSLSQTWAAQPALFVVEYALAKLWMSWGVQPAAMIGHSIGEYVAACLSGVFELADGLRLVAARGRLMQEMERGAMLAVMGTEAEVTGWMEAWRGRLWLGAVNTVGQCVVSGEERAIEELEAKLTEMEVASKRLKVSHAFHSGMMERAARAMGRYAREVEMREPEIAYISNVTGGWASGAEVGQSIYWGRQMRETVRWREGMEEVLRSVKGGVLLEVGPGQTLSRMARMAEGIEGTGVVWTLAGEEGREGGEDEEIKRAVGKLWVMGVEVEWEKVKGEEKRRRVELPGYAFERERYWIERGKGGIESGIGVEGGLRKKEDIADWFYVPSWTRSVLPQPVKESEGGEQKSRWLVFMYGGGLASRLVKELEQDGHDVISVTEGQHYARLADTLYSINPLVRDDYDTLLMHLQSQQRRPQRILHCWSLSPPPRVAATDRPGSIEPADPDDLFEAAQERGFYSLLYLAQALGKLFIEDSSGPGSDPLIIEVLSSDMQEVSGDEPLDVEKATLLGACRVIPQEYPHLRCRSIDVVMAESGNWRQQRLVEQLAAELKAGMTEEVVAYRGQHRWVQNFEAVRLEAGTGVPDRLRMGGVYLITGGTGGIGLEIARYLAETVGAKVVLVSRRGLGDEEEEIEESAELRAEREEKRKKVEEIERAGGEVLVLKGDVSDEGEMDEVIKRAKQRYGEIHGVIHAAGVPPGGLIQLKTPEIAASVLNPKVKGTQVLAKLFKDAKLDFMILNSSLRSYLSLAGGADYTAANSFLDAFAQHSYATEEGPSSIITINWDGWYEVGMGANSVAQLNSVDDNETTSEEALLSSEGIEVFKRILSSSLPQVIVSVQDFQARVVHNRSLTGSSYFEQLEKESQLRPTHPRPQLDNEYVAPRNEIEERMAEIWQAMLGISQVGIHDNFFELGGDSIISIQIIAKINQTGLQLSPKHFVDHQTIAALAEIASTSKAIQAEQGRVTGPLPLTPIQHWFFERNTLDPHHFNQSLLLEVKQPLDPLILEQSVQHLLIHHDALRLRFDHWKSGWQQVNALLPGAASCLQKDLSGLAEENQGIAIEAAAAEMQASLDLSEGPLMRVVLFNLGEDRPGRLLIVVHHLVIDGVSWRILLEDLQTVYEQTRRGEAIELPLKTTSFKYWAERLMEHAQAGVAPEEAAYWLAEARRQVASLPVDYPEGVNTEASARMVSTSLSAEDTQALVHDLPSLYRTQINEVLLTALAHAFMLWTATRSLVVDLEGHGREPILEDVDLSRTVGWFTSIFPVLLELEDGASLWNALKSIKEQLRSIPNKGIGYGLLRYLSDNEEIAEKMRTLPPAEVSFLYLGQLDHTVSTFSLFDSANESTGPNTSPRATRSHLLQVVGRIINGQLTLNLIYSENVHRRSTIERLAEDIVEALRALITNSQSPDAVGYTPSDFTEAELSQAELDELIAELSASEGYD